jgi:hypothetical protein
MSVYLVEHVLPVLPIVYMDLGIRPFPCVEEQPKKYVVFGFAFVILKSELNI